MENKDPQNVIYPQTGVAQPPQSTLGTTLGQVLDTNANSLSAPLASDPQALSQTPVAAPVAKRPNLLVRWTRRTDAVLAVLIVLGMVGVIIATSSKDNPRTSTNSKSAASNFDTQEIPLEGFKSNAQGVSFGASSVTINGPLKLNNGLLISPTGQPSSASAGQLYYDQTSNELAYFNGTEYVSLTGNLPTGVGISNANGQLSNAGVLSVQGQTGNVTLTAGGGIAIDGTTITNNGVLSLGGSTGAITLGDGLNIASGVLSNSGVTSFGGATGAITVGSGLSMSGGSVQNTGLLSAVSGSSNITVANDGSGNITISSTAGAGTVSSTGGTTGKLAKFSGAQSIADSLVSESGTIVTVAGDLAVTGALSLGTALTVANGGTGATSLTTNGVLIGQGSSAVTAVTAAGAGLCFQSTAGAPAFMVCPGGGGGGGVTSLDGLTGILTLANSTGVGSTITIDDASTAAKGIASFNATNFSVASGAVNTIQNINTGASPTFTGLTLSGDIAVNGGDITSAGALNVTPSGALVLGAVGQTATVQGTTTTITSNGAGNNIVLNAANTIELQDNTNITGNLDVSGTLVAGTADAFQVSSSGAVTAVGVNAGTGLIQGTGGVIVSGAASSLNANSNFATSINSGTSTGTITLGGGSAPLVIDSTNFDVTSAGAVSGVTTLNTSGIITVGSLGAADTATSLCRNSSNQIATCTAGTTAFVQGGNSFGATAVLGTNDNNQLEFETNNTTRLTVGAAGGVTVAANNNFVLSSGTGSFSQTYTGTTTDAASITANALTTASALKVTSSNNSAANTAWSATQLNITNAQGTTAVSTGSIYGFDVQFTQNPSIAGNTESVANFAVKQNDSSATDSTVSSIINVANNDTATGNQITATDGLKITGANITNGINLSGTFGTSLITSTNFSVSQAGAIVGVGVNSGTGAIQGTGGLTVSGAAISLNANSNFATSINTGTSSGTVTIGGGSAPLVIDSTNFDVSSAGALSGITTIATSGAINSQTISSTANFTGTVTVQGANALTLGVTGSTTGAVLFKGATAASGTITLVGQANPTGSQTITLPNDTGVVCLTSGNCAGSGSGVTTGGGSTNRLAKFTASQAINDSTVTDDGSNVTTSVDVVIQGGDLTVGTTSQQGSLVLHDGNGEKATLRVGSALLADTIISIPTSVGVSDTVCLLTLANCTGSGSGSTLQAAYAAGNTITTTGSRDIAFTLAADSSFTVATAAGTTGFTTFSLTDGSNATPPAQEVLIRNNDTNQALAAGLKVTSAAGGITTALDVSGSNITNALSIGANAIAGTNFSVTGAGAVTAVGVNAGAGLIQGTAGLTVSGAAISLNANSNFATNINTGTSTGTITLGGGSAPLAIDSTNFDVSTAGAVSGVTTLNTSGIITQGALGAADTSTFLCRNSSNQIASCTSAGAGAAFVQGGNTFAATAILGTNDSNQLEFETNNTTRVTIGATGGVTLAANNSLSLASGTGTFGQAYTGTTTDANTITANSLTTASAFKVTSSNNSAANTAWSATQLNITNAQATTAVSSGSIYGFDVQFTQNPAIAGNTESVANFALKQNDSSATDNTVASIINVANNDTATGNQITATDGIKITGTNVTNGINLSGTFGTNLITSTNFTVTQAGAVTGVGLNAGTGLIQGTGGLTVSGAAVSLNANSNFATSINTGTSNGTITLGGGSAPLVIDSTNFDVTSAGAVSGVTTLNTSGIITVGSIGSADTSTFLCRNTSNQIASCNSAGTGVPFVQGGNSFGATAVLGTNDNNQLEFETNNTTRVTIGATGGVTLAANNGLSFASGTGTFVQAYTGTTTDAASITANALTTASALKVTSSNNSAANTAWSATQLNVTNAQASTAVSTGTIAGLDLQFTQGTSVAGNTETVANFAVKQNDSSSTDASVASILNLANNDTATGNQITVADGIKITGTNVTNGINLSGTFGTNLITSTNFSVTQAGAITGVGVNAGTGTIQGTGGMTVSGAAISLNANSNFATSINTGTSSGTITLGGGSAPLVIDSTNFDVTSAGAVSGVTTLNTSGIITQGALGSADSVTYLCRNSSNQIASCQTTATGSAFLQGGNTFGGVGTVGTNDGFALNVETNNTTRLVVGASGGVTVSAANAFTVTSGLTSLTGATTGDALNVSNSTSTGNIAVFNDNATAVLTIADGGAATFQNTTNSANALRVLNSGGSELLGLDSTDSNARLLANNTGHLAGSSNAWISSSNTLPAARGIAGSVIMNGYLYVFGGSDGVSRQTTIYYSRIASDGSVGSWSTASAGLPVAAFSMGYATYNGYLYVNGGTSTAATGRDIFYAKPGADGNITAWTTQDDPTNLADHQDAGMAIHNGYMYIVGGTAVGGGAMIRHLYYARINADGSVPTFTVVTDWLPNGEEFLASSVFVANGYLYVFGSSNYDKLYYARIASDGTVGSAPTLATRKVTDTVGEVSRKYAALSVMNGNVYVIGGNTNGTTNVAYAPLDSNGDITTTFVTDSTSLLAARSVCPRIAPTFNNYMYLVGCGDGTFAPTSTVYYAGGARVKVGGGLDLVGLSGEGMSEGATGGQLTAGNTYVNGTLAVTGNAVLKDGLGVTNSLNLQGSFGQTYTGTSDANVIVANSLTTGTALKVTSSNNTAANTAWSAVQLNVTNAQASTAVSTGSIYGLDLQFTQNAGVTGNTESAANFAIKQNDSSSTDNTVTSIINVANNDTATGNQITATNGLLVTGTNITNGINLSGTFGTNLITSTNFSVTQAGAITGVGVNSGTGLIQGSGGLTISNGAISLESGTNTTSIGTNASARTISIGTGAAVQTITLGSTNSTSSLTLDSGTGTIGIGTGAQARSLNIGTGAAAQAVTLGSTNTTSTTVIQGGTGTAAGDINIGDQTTAGKIIDIGSVSNAGTTTVNIATAAAVQTITIGSTNSSSALTLNAGSGNAVLNATSGTVTLQTTTSGAVNIKPGGSSNVVVGTADSTGTLVVLDDKNDNTSDPTGVNGGMYYNSTRKAFRCYEGGMWGNCREISRTSVRYRSEFFNSSQDGPIGTFVTAGNGGVSYPTGLVNHPGYLHFDTGTTTTGSLGAGVLSNADDWMILGNGDTWRYETMVRIPTLSGSGQTFTAYLGFTDSGNGDATDGCYFKYSDTVNSGKWQGICADAGSSTCDTGITVGANTWYRLTIVVNSAGTSADFLTDGTSRCQVSSQIPITAGNETGANQHLTKTAGTTARTMDTDYLEIYADMTTR